jgi:hypothetical protein
MSFTASTQVDILRSRTSSFTLESQLTSPLSVASWIEMRKGFCVGIPYPVYSIILLTLECRPCSQRDWRNSGGKGQNSRIYQWALGVCFFTKSCKKLTTRIQSFHSDMCEVLSLYALDIAPEGGRTLVSSAWQVYNDLAARRPDILQTLANDWVLDT